MKKIYRVMDLARKIKTSESGCWIWPYTKNNGYGTFYYNGKTRNAHRVFYELAVKKIPKGLTIDHLCRVRACVNPKHLRVLSNRQNTLIGIGPTAINHRKKKCKQGHPFSFLNTRTTKYGRKCRLCEYIDSRRRRRKRLGYPDLGIEVTDKTAKRYGFKSAKALRALKDKT